MEGTKGSYWSFILFSLTVACLLLILKLKWSVFANGFCGGSRVLVENEEGLNIWFKHGKKTSSIFVKIKWLKISKYCAHWIMSVFFGLTKQATDSVLYWLDGAKTHSYHQSYMYLSRVFLITLSKPSSETKTNISWACKFQHHNLCHA